MNSNNNSDDYDYDDDTDEYVPFITPQIPKIGYVPYKNFANKTVKVVAKNHSFDPFDSAFPDYLPFSSDLKEPEKYPEHFSRIRRSSIHILLHHSITNERKWVEINEMLKEGVSNAFYDADIHFSPEGEKKY